MVSDYNSGLTLHQIGQKHNITRERVRQIMEKLGAPRRQQISFKPKPCVCGCGKMTPEKYNNRKYAKDCKSPRPRKYPRDLIERIPELYDTGLSEAKVAKILGMSSANVHNRLVKMNHPRRDFGIWDTRKKEGRK